MTLAKFSRFPGVLLIALVVTLHARAEAPAPPKTYAVIVGIGNYKDDQIKKRKYAENDAKSLYDLFTDKQYLGIDKADAHLLIGAEATRAKILSTLKEVTAQARSQDLVLFAFIGNGAPLGEAGDRRAYLAADSTFAGREKDSLAASEIGAILKKLKSRFCGFVDVDFKGFTAKAAFAEPRLGDAPYKEFLGDDGSDEHLSIPGRILYLATNGLHTSLDLDKHGLFTQVLLGGLKGAADKAGYEPDGVVTVDELTTYLDKNLPDLARKNGKTKEEKEQQNFVLGGRGCHYVLTYNPAVFAKRVERLDSLAKLAKEGKLPAPLAEEGRILLERMPKLESRQKLRKEYQAFADGKISLDDLKKQRDVTLAETKVDAADALRYASKVMEVVDLIKEKHIKKVSADQLVVWAVRGLYRRLDEPVPAEIEAKLKGAAELSEEKLKLLLAEVRQVLGKREDLAKYKDLDLTLQSMLRNLDPYTTYIDPDQLERFSQETQGFFTGIGIQIRKDNVSDRLQVVTPILGSPAYKAGLLPGDIIKTIIREVDNMGEPLKAPDVIDTKGLLLSDAVKKILGKAGTKVKVIVERDGKPITFELARARIETESVLGVKREANDEWNYILDPSNKIAYLRLTSFQRNSYRDLKAVMQKLTKKYGIKGFILDLRFNPGGLLNSAVDISDLFIDDGLIVSIRERNKPEERYSGFRDGSLLDFPMVCMVNNMSASASEIVSAALQDHRRAYIVGDRSYGKGSVQKIVEFPVAAGVRGEVKLTTASFWRPSGKNLNKSSTSGKDTDVWGVTPDKIVHLTPKEQDDLFEAQRETEIIRHGQPAKEPKKEFKDKQLEAALDYLRGEIKLSAQLPK